MNVNMNVNQFHRVHSAWFEFRLNLTSSPMKFIGPPIQVQTLGTLQRCIRSEYQAVKNGLKKIFDAFMISKTSA